MDEKQTFSRAGVGALVGITIGVVVSVFLGFAGLAWAAAGVGVAMLVCWIAWIAATGTRTKNAVGEIAFSVVCAVAVFIAIDTSDQPALWQQVFLAALPVIALVLYVVALVRKTQR